MAARTYTTNELLAAILRAKVITLHTDLFGYMPVLPDAIYQAVFASRDINIKTTWSVDELGDELAIEGDHHV